MNSEQMMRNRLMERVLERNPSSARALQEVRACIQAAEAAEAAKAAEARAGTERAMERIKKKLDAKHAAQAALSLAKRAKTPEDMLAKAETAIAMYMQYSKHMTSQCSDYEKQLLRAKDVAAFAKLGCAKWHIHRWVEQYWDLFI
jgi:hypothetical protein